MPVVIEAGDDEQARDRECDANGGAEPAEGALRADADSDAPLAGKIPEAVAEMKGRRDDSDYVECKIVGILHRVGDIGIGGHAAGGEALDPDMPADEEEGDDAAPALQDVEPVGHPGVAESVGFALPPNIEAVETVEKDGKPDAQGFDEQAPRDGLEIGRSFVVFGYADERVAVGPEMFGQKCADGDDAGKRVEFIEDVALT